MHILINCKFATTLIAFKVFTKVRIKIKGKARLPLIIIIYITI
jgi:hypothetical protein